MHLIVEARNHCLSQGVERNKKKWGHHQNHQGEPHHNGAFVIGSRKDGHVLGVQLKQGLCQGNRAERHVHGKSAGGYGQLHGVNPTAHSPPAPAGQGFQQIAPWRHSIVRVSNMLSLRGMPSRTGAMLPGLAVAGVAVAVGFAIHELASGVSALTVSLVLGVLLGNSGLLPTYTDAGLKFASRHLLRAGIVLLGLQLSLREVAHLGGKGFVAVIAVVAITFFGTQFIAQWLRVSPGLGLLTATGYSICGVSAVSAMTGAVDGDEEDATYAIALVTLFGSVSIFMLPIIGHLFDMGNVRFGLWAGSAVHDVAQVVATSTAYSPESLKGAVIVKLTRVMLLAPLVAMYAYNHRRASAKQEPHSHEQRVSPLPMFIVLFLVMVCVRTTDVLSADVLSWSKNIEKILLALALVGLGASVKFSKLRILGARPLLLGVFSWLLVMGTSLATIRLIPLDF